MADLTSGAKVPLLPLHSTPQYICQHACHMCVTLLIGYHAFCIPWLRLRHGGHGENCRHLEFVSGTRTLLKE